MNKIESLRDELVKQFPGCTIRLTAPVRPTTDYWTLDVTHAGRWVVVDWLPPADRYGVSAPTNDTGYGDGPDEVFFDDQSALQRVSALLMEKPA